MTDNLNIRTHLVALPGPWVEAAIDPGRSERTAVPDSSEPFLTRLGRNPRFQTVWVIWSCLWALFWITIGWFLLPVFNLGMFAASVAVAVAGRPRRPPSDPAAWNQTPPTLAPKPPSTAAPWDPQAPPPESPYRHQ